MNELPPQLLESVGSAGLPALLMFLAIRWLVTSNKELVSQLNQERTDRMQAMEEHIEECKTHIQECDADRHALRSELLRLAQARGDDVEMPRDPPTTHFTSKSKPKAHS